MIGDNLKALYPQTPFRQADILLVVGIGDDPRDVVVGDDQSSRTIPCLASYSGRTIGDQVLAVQLSGGGWLVLGRIGADDATVPTSPTVQATSSRGWAVTGDLSTAEPRTGSDGMGPDWFGAWFYSGGIAAACAGRTVTGMSVRIARAASGGSPGPVRLQLGLHNQPDMVKPPTITAPWSPVVRLSRGQTVTVAIPSSQRAQLASGTATGITVTGTGPLESAVYSTAADIFITFG